MNRIKKSLAAALILLAIGEFASSRVPHGASGDAGPAAASLSTAAPAMSEKSRSGGAGGLLLAPAAR